VIPQESATVDLRLSSDSVKYSMRKCLSLRGICRTMNSRFGLPGREFSFYGSQAVFDARPLEKEHAVMLFSYETAGSCATRIDIEIEAGFIVSAEFIDGCAGNTKAIGALVRGMPVSEAVRRLKGISCQGDTSCPDQLARALESAEMK